MAPQAEANPSLGEYPGKQTLAVLTALLSPTSLLIITLLAPQATASATFAVLLGLGTGALVEDTEMVIRVGGRAIHPDNVEKGTGFIEQRWLGETVNAGMGLVEVQRRATNVAWGGLHWQRFGSMTTVEALQTGPLTVKKELRGREPGTTKYSPLSEVSVRPGVEILVRLVVRSDRYGI